MRHRLHASIAAAGLATLLALPSAATVSAPITSAQDGAVSEGDIVDYKFRTPPMNSNGLVNLADLRGRPLLIEYWGTR